MPTWNLPNVLRAQVEGPSPCGEEWGSDYGVMAAELAAAEARVANLRHPSSDTMEALGLALECLGLHYQVKAWLGRG